jgi:hypothetical protein
MTTASVVFVFRLVFVFVISGAPVKDASKMLTSYEESHGRMGRHFSDSAEPRYAAK